MKIILLSFFSIFSIGNIYSQNLDKQFIDGTCECYSRIKADEFNDDLQADIADCFEEVMKNLDVDAFLMEILEKEYDSIQRKQLTYEDGYELGRKWAEETLGKSIDSITKNCDGYYNVLLQARKHSYISASMKEESLNQVKKINLKIKDDSLNETLLMQRSYHYIVIGDFEKARDDLNKCSEISPNNYRTIALLALSYEYEKKYILALEHYIKANEIHENFQFKAAIAYLRRKLSEKY